MAKEIWLGMQPDEDVAKAACGCTLYRNGEAAAEIPGAGHNDDPLYVQCVLHEQAGELLAALEHVVSVIGAEGEQARQLISRAKGGQS